MNDPTLFGLCGAALVGLGLYGLLCQPGALRKILAFNLIGSGVFPCAAAGCWPPPDAESTATRYRRP